MVVIFFPTALATAVWQERVADPSRCTVHAPQRPMPQPYLVPVICNRSRRTQSSGISPSASTIRLLPFTSSENCAIVDLKTMLICGRGESYTFAGKRTNLAGKRVQNAECRPVQSGSGPARREQVLPAGFTHPDSLPVMQNDRPLALPFAKNLANMIEIHDGGTMYANEFAGIERACELFDGLAQEKALRTHMQ